MTAAFGSEWLTRFARDAEQAADAHIACFAEVKQRSDRG